MESRPARYRFMARVIRDFARGVEDPGENSDPSLPLYAWDDWLVSVKHQDAVLDRVATECGRVNLDYPAVGQYCNADGVKRLVSLADELDMLAIQSDAEEAASDLTAQTAGSELEHDMRSMSEDFRFVLRSAFLGAGIALVLSLVGVSRVLETVPPAPMLGGAILLLCPPILVLDVALYGMKPSGAQDIAGLSVLVALVLSINALLYGATGALIRFVGKLGTRRAP